ncbi:acid phosphatase-like 2 [Elysia marginata]|uniref:2-phosphoxylose phosphatase 1 n=1 Tax=Elysia marginata TaxID=1093978 RepID=A0AAV4J878_9GAST|nr:acid phosphatase-like 2 [Elysia marginata]
MYSPRCGRIVNMRVLAVCGILSAIVTTFLTLRYTADPRPPVRGEFLQGSGALKGTFEMHVKKLRTEPVVTKCNNPQVSDSRPLLSVPRVAKYCNIPNSEPPGDEGLVLGDMKLLGAHVVIRHGDRAPLVRLPGEETPSLSCLVDSSQFHHLPKVQNYEHVMAQASQMEERQEDLKSDFNRWALYPSRPECAEGQLTGQGAIQQVLSGLHLHQRYTESPNNLRVDYSTVAVHSTVTSRTYQSALAFMYGFLPEFDHKQLKVKGTSSILFCDSNAVPGSVCFCPGLETLRGKAFGSCRGDETAIRSLATYEASALKTLTHVLGVPATSIPAPEGVMDALSRYACHSIPPPCVTLSNNSSGNSCTTTTCIDARTMEEIWASVDAQSRCVNQNSDYKKFATAATQGLLLRIAQGLLRIALRNTTNTDNVPLFVLYSGHDNTITPLIAALGINDRVWPGYATRLVFELYERASTPDVKAQHFVRILLNGKAVTRETVFCRAGSVLSGGDDLCEFERFHGHMTSMKLQEFCTSIRSQKLRNARKKRVPVKTGNH